MNAGVVDSVTGDVRGERVGISTNHQLCTANVHAENGTVPSEQRSQLEWKCMQISPSCQTWAGVRPFQASGAPAMRLMAFSGNDSADDSICLAASILAVPESERNNPIAEVSNK